MKVFIKVFILLYYINTFSQSYDIDNLDAYLETQKGFLVFSIKSKKSDFIVQFSDTANEWKPCNHITKNQSQFIIEILSKYGLLNYHHAFLKEDLDSLKLKEQNAVLSFELNSINTISNNPIFIIISDINSAKKLISEIDNELNYSDCFLKLRI